MLQGHRIILTREQNDQLLSQQFSLYPNVECEDVVSVSANVQIQTYPPAPGYAYPLCAVEIPASPGVYFLLRRSRNINARQCYYVGSSVNLKSRVTKSHERIKEYPNCLVAWLPTKRDDRIWTECYFVGLLRPEKNAACPVGLVSKRRLINLIKKLVAKL